MSNSFHYGNFAGEVVPVILEHSPLRDNYNVLQISVISTSDKL